MLNKIAKANTTLSPVLYEKVIKLTEEPGTTESNIRQVVGSWEHREHGLFESLNARP